MPTANTQVAMSVGGVSISGTVSRTAEGQKSEQVVLAAASGGTLSTRTNTTDGVLTLTANHGIANAAIVDIFWTDTAGDMQVAYAATVGTVNGTSVPFSAASGVSLPAANYAITACTVTPINITFDGDNVVMIGVGSSRNGHFHMKESTNSICASSLLANEPWLWWDGTTAANPLTGEAVTVINVSNGDAVNTATVKVAMLYDSVV